MSFICKRNPIPSIAGKPIKNVWICDLSGANPMGPDQKLSQGKLSETYVDKYINFFKSFDTDEHKVTITTTRVKDIKDPLNFDFDAETKKWASADLVVFTFGLWWFGIPGWSKVYLDALLNRTYGTLFKGDGRTAADTEHGYGSGGLLKETLYMINVTTNAPNGAYMSDRMEGELKNRRIDDIMLQMHGTAQFLGMTKIPDSTFHHTDVHHDLKFKTGKDQLEGFEAHFQRWEKHINELFGKATETTDEKQE